MSHLNRKILKAIAANANNLMVFLPTKVVKMPQATKEEIIEIPEEIPEAEPDMGFVEEETGRMPFQGGYSSRSKAQGDGLTSIFSGYRGIGGDGSERW